MLCCTLVRIGVVLLVIVYYAVHLCYDISNRAMTRIIPEQAKQIARIWSNDDVVSVLGFYEFSPRVPDVFCFNVLLYLLCAAFCCVCFAVLRSVACVV